MDEAERILLAEEYHQRAPFASPLEAAMLVMHFPSSKTQVALGD